MAISNYTKEDRNEHITPDSSFLALTPCLSLYPKSVFRTVSTQCPFYRQVWPTHYIFHRPYTPGEKNQTMLALVPLGDSAAAASLCRLTLLLCCVHSEFQWFCSCTIVSCCFSKTGSHHVGQAVLKLRESTSLCLLGAGVEGVCHPTWFVSCLALALTLERGLWFSKAQYLCHFLKPWWAYWSSGTRV